VENANLLSLRASPLGYASHVPVCELPSAAIAQLAVVDGAPLMLQSTAQGPEVIAWCFSQRPSSQPDADVSDHSEQPWAIALNLRLRQRLGVEVGEMIHVRAGTECTTWRTIASRMRPPPVGTLQTGGPPKSSSSVEVAVDRVLTAAEGRANVMHVVCHDGVVFPVVLRVASPADTAIRLDFYTRMLMGAAPESPITLWPLDASMQRELCGQAWREREIDQLVVRRTVETVLRRFLGAPVLALRAVYSLPGDEDQSICRIHDRMFTLLGVREGDKLILQWGHRSSTGTALPHVRSDDTRGYERSTGVRQLTANEIPVEYHIGIPASMLSSFGAPRDSVVLVRRDVLSLVASNAIVLALPLTGLLLALISKTHWYLLVLIVLTLLFISLLPLRRSTASRTVTSARVAGD
jgi:hypothetical protein